MSQGFFKTILTILFVAEIFIGCNEQDVFFSSQPVSPKGWRSLDTLFFDIDTLQYDALYELEVNLRTTDSYPYKSIWILVKREFSNPSICRIDTVECPIMDSETLRRNKGVHLSPCSVQLPPMILQKGQPGCIRLTHLMLREYLPGVHDVGIRISLRH